MSAITIQQMADRVAELLEERLRIKGADLAAKVQKGGRQLPRRVRVAAQNLADAALRAKNPKLLMMIDEEAVATNYDICVKHLSALNRWDRRKGFLIGFATSTLFSLLVVAGLALAVMVWRGLL